MDSSISLDKAIKHSVKTITKALGSDIIGIERVVKIYGSNANSFILKTLDKDNRLKTYILKFSRNSHIENEITGDLLVFKFLPIPNLILTSNRKFVGLEWVLYDYIDGELMIEKFIDSELRGKNKEFVDLETRKEELLTKAHNIKKKITFKNYLSSKTNLLFYSRINGDRYKSFYQNQPNNLSKFFNKRITVNGFTFPKTICEHLEEIRQKYKKYADEDSVMAILGHGDAHHGNIIVNKKIYFIDNEYAGYIPPFMELAKPYYNDFLGTLFFHYNSLLSEYFKVVSIKDEPDNLIVKVDIQKQIKLRVTVTETKLASRRLTVNKETLDFLSLNDYLVLCHILTKNPHNYGKKAQMLFLVFTLILANFDPFNPSSIYKFFEV